MRDGRLNTDKTVCVGDLTYLAKRANMFCASIRGEGIGWPISTRQIMIGGQEPGCACEAISEQ